MNPLRPHHRLPARHNGFSLVEVAIAIGIFAFVVVGVMGLLPAGLRMRADSATETRGVLIAEELFAAVRASTNLAAVAIRIGPKLNSGDIRTNNILATPPVLGFPAQTTMPYYFYGWSQSPGVAWTNAGGSSSEIAASAANAIDTIARLSATRVTNGLYNVTVEVRAPASIPLTNSRPSTFSTLIYSPGSP
jgi:prepilin-type N-terminal cleavage/methylation domain-containing protein